MSLLVFEDLVHDDEHSLIYDLDQHVHDEIPKQK